MANKILKLTEFYGKESLTKQLDAARVAKDNEFYEQAIRWFERLSSQDEDMAVKAESYLELAYIYLHVDGFTDFKKCSDYLYKASQYGSIKATSLIGFYSIYGDGPFSKNVSVGIDWLRTAANQGEKDALNELGSIYCRGLHGVVKDFKRGMEYFQKSANLGHLEGFFNLAASYYNKKEDFYDLNKALKWYQKAADLGDKEAIEMANKIRKENKIR